MKNIGILTFQSTVNYGAQLQNYALQKYILDNNKGMDVYVINYNNKKIDSIEKNLFLKDQTNLKDLIKYIKNGKSKRLRWEKFEEFRKQYIRLTKECNSENIKEIDRDFDYYIVGSDQVWNLDITGEDYNYFLEFVNENKKKFSYAASLGKSYFEEKQSKKMVELLNKFEVVNVREKTAEKFLRQFKISNVNTVMDPTFLLSKEDWQNNFELKKLKGKKDYILVYMIDNVKENFKKIKDFARKNNLEIIYITSDFMNISNVKNIRDASPIDFLNYINNAKYVITGSFHAICFSLIFNKEFYYIFNQKNGRNSRLSDLMDVLNIENDITEKNEIEKKDMNYKTISDKLNELIKDSKNKLNEIIKEKEK